MRPQSGAAQTRRVRRTEVEWSCVGSFDNPVLGISACSFQGYPRRLNVIFRPHPTSRISLGIKKNRWRCDLPFAHHSAKDRYLYTKNVCYLLRGYFGLSHFFHRNGAHIYRAALPSRINCSSDILPGHSRSFSSSNLSKLTATGLFPCDGQDSIPRADFNSTLRRQCAIRTKI